MSVFTLVALNAANGSLIPFVFDVESEYLRALEMARDAGRLVTEAGEDYVTDADEFSAWLEQSKANPDNPRMPAMLERALVLCAYRTIEDHVSDLQRDDGTPAENKELRDCAIANALEDAANILGLELGTPENYGDALHALHEFVDANYPPTFALDDDGHAVALPEDVERDDTLGDVLSLIGPRKVRVSARGVALFNAQWPCSNLRTDRAYWFEFSDDGELVDSDVPNEDDGDACVAMSEDCARWFTDGDAPAWCAP
jgi:hypothetical protein